MLCHGLFGDVPVILREVQQVDTDRIPTSIKNQYIKAILVAIIGNAALVAAKAFAASLSNSSAIMADTFNSVGDIIYSVLMAVGLLLSLKPADASHPHGHRRIEALVSLFIGLGMSVAGFAAVKSGITKFQTGPESITSVYAYLTPLLVLVVKSIMYLVVNRVGKTASSPAILASARDNLNDVISSVVVLISVVVSRFFAAADPVGALLVSVWIFRGVYLVMREAVGDVTGGAGSPELTQRIIEVASSIPGVLDVHQVILEHVGPDVRADVHINMDGSLPLVQVHHVSDTVKAAIENIEGVEHAFIHVEPPEEKPAKQLLERPIEKPIEKPIKRSTKLLVH
ncbi:MAG: cation diffusion facilitator family transporter [Chloroflexi bacterium]|nr:cation diffusion facilitator family transporter [Chloroflexota bacterium]